MDESGDYFRIATNGWSADNSSPEGGSATSSVSVLTQAGDELDLVGRVKNIAKGESLQSARFVGDQAYVVTFHQIDPLFVVDLSNPTSPRVAGQLDLPGYSSYLQPIGNNLLLGLGRDVDAGTGQDNGLQVSLFDVSNPASPQRLAKYALGQQWSSSEAEYDHHAFSYFSDQQILALPVDQSPPYVDAGGGGTTTGGGTLISTPPIAQPTEDLIVLKVDPAGKQFQKLGEATPPGGVRRSLRIDDVLYAVGPDHVQAMQLDQPSNVIGVLDTSG
jgi:uncharacterized secreted protein with C-terminal beta-propeller domain